MGPKLYGELAPWWPLVSTPEDYAEEALIFAVTLDSLSRRPIREMLELGCGGGNNASFLKHRYAMTLTDLSPGMLEVSRALNPECPHVEGDMRAIRLETDFDAVLIHDAIMYMTTEEDLAAAIGTARAHLRPGGVALFVPDHTVESYRPRTTSGGHDGDGRAVRYLEWWHPSEAGTTTTRTTFVFALRDGDAPVEIVHDEHVTGLFPRSTWLRLIEDADMESRALPDPHGELEQGERELFAGIAPG
jgi:SAM-dependent methyltransferase